MFYTIYIASWHLNARHFFRSASTHLLNITKCLLLFTTTFWCYFSLYFYTFIVFSELSLGEKLVYSLKATHSQFSLKTRKLEFYYLVPRFFCFFFISFFLFSLSIYSRSLPFIPPHRIDRCRIVVVNVIVFIRESIYRQICFNHIAFYILLNQVISQRHIKSYTWQQTNKQLCDRWRWWGHSRS